MKDANELHNESMDRAELALLARMRGEHETAEHLFAESLQLEIAAIEAIEKLSYTEPNYSILHRSAATLALDCNDPRTAERLISKALAHDPPLQIAEELRDLFEQVHFRRHLQLRGIILSEDELQMSLAGQGVGFGVVHSNEFLQRVDDASKIIYRIAERRQSKPFREKGRPSRLIKDDYELFLSVPRAASFAVTLKLGHPSNQPKLPGFADTYEIVDEFMTLMGLVNKADFPAIESRIPDPAYRMNFVQLAKRLAPDGDNVKVVGFTSIHEGHERFVEIIRPKTKIIAPEPKFAPQAEMVTVRGVLKFADATHRDSGHIKIVDEENKNTTHQVKVPEGMMNDIVKPLWDTTVVIKGTRERNYILLQDIEEG
ncbi:MAG: hypothetical protein C0399_04240 [Syntrophus sp. (in: bacteria)]|nr:hypothetical protein [Syntrophus sp. (in: bacteria)]